MKKLHEILEAVREKQPLIHCITNPISINQCANGILAIGARPMMAEHPKEVQEITETAGALILNLGNITDARMQSMEISLQTAKEKHIPVLLDAVGIACSKLRRDYVAHLLNIGIPTVIKGNYSEIYALYQGDYRSSGVDADTEISKTDVVTDGKRLVRIHNGTKQLSSVTGTGCMLGALCGAYLSVCTDMDAAVAGCAVLGICGELAETEKGSGSFMVNLMDALSTLTAQKLEQYISMEETQYAEI